MNRFAKYAWSVLGYTLFVILWGAFVRATGSGAGCGAHWPLCNGVVVPRTEQIETFIELFHRTTSGIAGLLVLILFLWAWRRYPKGHLVRHGALLSLIFIIIEGGLGAGLVLFELVANNVSVARAVSMALHLANTFLLVTVLTLTARWATHPKRPLLRNQGMVGWLLLIGFLGMLLLGVTGAVTALGDTLFPAESLIAGIQQDFAPTANFLLRLRVWHPLLAVGLGIFLIVASRLIIAKRPSAANRKFALIFKLLFVTQLGVGVLNLLLRAPIVMQLIHLLMADLVLIAFVLMCASVLAETAVSTLQTTQPLPQTGD